MRVEYARCDACKAKLGEGSKLYDRMVTITTGWGGWNGAEIDVCEPCWEKMCKSVGLEKPT